MKNRLKNISVFFLCSLLFACEYEEINRDPNNSTSIEPGPLLTYVQLYLNPTTGGVSKNIQVGTCMMIVQQTATLQRETMPGDKYYPSESSGTMFNDNYGMVIKNLAELKVTASEDEKYENTLAVAHIWGAYLFNRLTDLFGDIPYTDAGMGYYEQNYYPAYDSQQSIYAGLINDIKTGLNLLDTSKPGIEGDIIYNGDISKWKKFGNSMLLRLGMRMSKVDAELAKKTVTEALQGGVMSGQEDMTMINPLEGESRTENQVTTRFIMDNFIELGQIKISKTFMDHLKQTHDPRLTVFCSLPDGDTDPDKQRGLPNGYDFDSITEVEPDYSDHNVYSNFNTNTILQRSAPTIFMSSAETELLQAEAVVRGWISGNANTHYENAVRNSMKEQAVYGAGGIISDEAIDNYLSQNLFANAQTTEDKLNVIGTEFWVATFMNGYESYANWRRLGYPVLTPTNFAGSPNRGKIPRRLIYPTKEYTINKANIEQAIQRQGADDLNTRMWWDK
ncbi:MAG: SusD/RagB family nutrient-binding outer membrane lipoprotein [Tannerellaceae bacterium]|nr:SusD/RagB family nutrient-binding outer membrane lipoprotein [Tannerellaceae bacterium]